MKTYNQNEILILLNKYIENKRCLSNLKNQRQKLQDNHLRYEQKINQISPIKKSGYIIRNLFFLIITMYFTDFSFNLNFFYFFIFYFFMESYFYLVINHKCKKHYDKSISELNNGNNEIFKSLKEFLDDDIEKFNLETINFKIDKHQKNIQILKDSISSDMLSELKRLSKLNSNYTMAIKELNSYHGIKTEGFLFQKEEEAKILKVKDMELIKKLISKDKLSKSEIDKINFISKKMLNKKIQNN